MRKIGIAIVAVFLGCGLVVPPSQAQTRTYSNILALNQDGAYLGVQMKDVSVDNMSKYKLGSEKGVIVSSVIKGSPAETANIKEDDVILEFGGFPVWSSSQLARMIQETPAGRKVDIVVSRDGVRTSLSATLESPDRRSAQSRSEALIMPREWNGPYPWMYQFGPPEMPDGMPDTPDRRGSEPAPQRARLGVTLQPLTDQLGAFLGVPGKKGVLVASVSDGSPCAGKLQSGDVIIGVDGKAVENPDELTRQIRAKSEGDVTIKLIRNKKETSVVVSLPGPEDKGYKL